MAKKGKISPEKHKEQILAFGAVRACYETYAKTLERVLSAACKHSFPEALIQSRAKTVSSFAEKVARKCDRYPDAVNQMTDLCGARVIVQTTDQVKAVRKFIETNFAIVESDDKGLLLGEQEFGYRDMHYIIQLRQDRDASLGIKPEERAQILDRKAEVQVRTWVQHAWADTLHDRIYKNKLKISSEAKRTGNLLAALMEEGDRNFNRLADELDGLIANYTAAATRSEIEEEIEVQQLILNNETSGEKMPQLASKLARLVMASGDYSRVVQLLMPHAKTEGAIRCELLLDLGYALCRLHRNTPFSAEYVHGRNCLEEAWRLCTCSEVPFAPHIRKRESLHARILSRLGWALEPIPGEEHQAREYYRLAHEHESANPYYLADMLGFEMYCTRERDLPACIRTTIHEAIRSCRQHAAGGMELPYAYFTAGRLHLLVEEAYDALGCFARGIRHCLEGTYCVPTDAIADEIQWLKRIHFGVKIPRDYEHIADLLTLSQDIGKGGKPSTSDSPPSPPVLIISGGAADIEATILEGLRPLLLVALRDFRGTVVSGGTAAGVSGCVGGVALELAGSGRKQFQLIGYLPKRLPRGVSAHGGYDRIIEVGDDFLPDQTLHIWKDILAAGGIPREVLLLGCGGDPLSAVEYRVALCLGASIGLVSGIGGTADELLQDPLWSSVPGLYPLPPDRMTVRAFVNPGSRPYESHVLEAMAEEIHARYVASNTRDLPANLKPWKKLDPSFKEANLEQAAYAVNILKAAGLGIRRADDPVVFDKRNFTPEEVEYMAELEHGRWNVERLKNGWRLGARDDAKKLHDCLVPWRELSDGPDGVKIYDRRAVTDFPVILAKAKLEVYRP